ncbi:sugar ABC transporter substrate-binding protein [Intestinibacillus sp. Marseille-P6563]|uniref:sugar ABC transporter substrate-binding protein n=1 Tax=Intestinibacillus sp. Marseille-P6563 TaxID=2364792 RepID=UPI000F05C506|nr:substrate-binding domain-containing protein [Intestinibacillus sp. Marseille-P6563]
MKKRRLFAALTAAALAVSMTACTSSSDSGTASGSSGGEKKDISEIVVGLSIGNTTEERWNREIEMFQDYADEKGFELNTQIANNDANKQISQCENLINQGVDVLIVQSLDAEAAGPIVDAAHDAGIKVIAYDRFIMNSDLDYYVTFDSYKVGETEAKFVVEAAPKGNYIWLKGAPEDNNAHLVAEGQKDVLQPYIDSGDITIVTEQWCKGWDPNEALKHTENGLTVANNDVQGVIASNDGTAGAAVEALAAQGLAGTVPICGQDADLAACQRIVEGTQTGTVYKPLAPLNQAACELAVAIATGEDPKSSVDSSLGTWQTLNNNTKDVDSFTVDVEAVNKDNIYEIICVRDQFHTVEEVYANVPKDQWPTEADAAAE